MIDRQKEPRRPLRVCYFGTYRASYTRNQILIAGLRAQDDVVVYECHSTLWHGVNDRVAQASGGWRNPRFWGRVLAAYWRLLRAHSRVPTYDVMLVGYPGQLDSYLARLLTWWRRKPLALDILMSLHLVAEERGLTAKSPWTGRLLFWLEKGGLKLPDLLFAENEAYETYIRQKYNLPPGRFRRLPHGADDRVYCPRPLRPPDDCFRVTYHGSYLPSHGLETVIGAARLLREQPHIQFHLFGDGPQKAAITQAVAREGLDNVFLHGFVSRDELLDNLARSHLCLGVFGTTRQSSFTVQNKVWEGLAMARPVVSGDSPTVREALTHGEHIFLVARQDPAALAEAIRTLQADPALRERLALGGYRRFQAGNAVASLGHIAAAALQELAG